MPSLLLLAPTLRTAVPDLTPIPIRVTARQCASNEYRIRFGRLVASDIGITVEMLMG